MNYLSIEIDPPYFANSQLVVNVTSNGWWKCIHVACSYVSTPFISRNVVPNWVLHLH